MNDEPQCEVSRCVHPAYIAIRFTTSPDREHLYCQVHDARTEDGPRAKHKFGWEPKTIEAVRRL